MADNTTLNTMTGGDVIATDDISGVKYQINKVAWGPLNTANLVGITSGNPFPTQARGSDGSDRSITAFGTTWTITRPNNTTACAANQVIGTTTSAGGAVIDFGVLGPSAVELLIQSLTLEIDDTALKSGEGAYAFAFYNASPGSNLGDAGAWTLPSGDRAAYLGMVTIGTPNVPLASATTLRAELDNIGKQVTLSGTHLFGYLITLNAYTPTANRVYSGSVHTLVP